ncbi:MAG: DUF229 domain-containing protein [Acidobacteria bacterium]|nr:MAG: DUF229 domain-containing protein [Acidobacteriota bacterium]
MSHTLRDFFTASLWFGLFAGIFEATARSLPRLVPGWHTDSPVEILWIAPAFNLALYLALGAVLMLLSRLIKAVNLRLALGLFVAVFLFGVLFSLDLIGRLPALILALGVGVQSRRSILGREKTFVKYLRYSLPLLVIVAVLLASTGLARHRWQENRRVAELPPPRQPGPNVILITADTLRADHLSAYGYARRTTPFLDRLAVNGVLFEAAFSNSSWTLPSHASMFTGRLPNMHGADWQAPLDSRYPTLAQALAAEGYVTAAFAANREYVTPEWGLGRGFTHFEVFNGSLADYAMRTVYGKRLALNILPRLGFYDIPGRTNAAQLNAGFLRWLDRSERKPFFAFINYMEAHDPYLTQPEYSTRFSAQPSRGDLINFQFGVAFRRKADLSDAEVQREIDGYDAALAYLDDQLDRLFDELETRGLLGNTIVIVTSDHGEAFGNHNLFGHGNSLYKETLHVPLIFYGPGRIPPGRRVSEVAGLSQLPSTVMDIIGRKPEAVFPGESMAPLWAGGDAAGKGSAVYADLRPGRFQGGPDFYPNSREGWSSIITHDWHLLTSDSGQTGLYAWREDPQETHDLAADPSKQEVIKRLQQELSTLRSNRASR